MGFYTQKSEEYKVKPIIENLLENVEREVANSLDCPRDPDSDGSRRGFTDMLKGVYKSQIQIQRSSNRLVDIAHRA